MIPFKPGDIICSAYNPALEQEVVLRAWQVSDGIQLVTRPHRKHAEHITIWQPQSRWHCKPADLKTKRLEFLAEEVARSLQYAHRCEEEAQTLQP